MGRVLPTVAVGYAVAQLGGRLSGGEIARPTGAGRPVAVLLVAWFGAVQRTFNGYNHDDIKGRGPVTNAASRRMSANGDITSCAVPSRHGVL